jgi:deoxyribose-phosphate aldolase
VDSLNLASYIDHTLLRADAAPADIERLCAEAIEYGFHSVCVNPLYVQLAASKLVQTKAKTCSVIGFPLGASSTQAKVAEAVQAIRNGAQELDMVIAIGLAKAGEWGLVESDIAAVVEAARDKALVKIIIECCLLSDEEKVAACEASMRAGADFVKTSTGFSTGGATTGDVKLMRQTVGENLGVKASGGIKTREDALRMIEAGASRLGTSNGIAIVQGL